MGKVELHLNVDAELIADAAARGVALEQVFEEAVRHAIAAEDRRGPSTPESRATQWATENAEAIRVHNERIATRGIFGEDLRRW